MRADRCRRWAWWLGARGGGYRARGRRAPSAPKSKLEPLGKEKVKLPFPIWFGHGHVPAPERHTELRDLTHLRTSCARPPWRSSARAWPCSAAVRTAGQRLLELGLVPDRRAARRRRRCPARMNERTSPNEPGGERGVGCSNRTLKRYFSLFFSHARTDTNRTEGGGVSCAAVLLVRLAPPLPVLHPGKRGGYKGNWKTPV